LPTMLSSWSTFPRRSGSALAQRRKPFRRRATRQLIQWVLFIEEAYCGPHLAIRTPGNPARVLVRPHPAGRCPIRQILVRSGDHPIGVPIVELRTASSLAFKELNSGHRPIECDRNIPAYSRGRLAQVEPHEVFLEFGVGVRIGDAKLGLLHTRVAPPDM